MCVNSFERRVPACSLCQASVTSSDRDRACMDKLLDSNPKLHRAYSKDVQEGLDPRRFRVRTGEILPEYFRGAGQTFSARLSLFSHPPRRFWRTTNARHS